MQYVTLDTSFFENIRYNLDDIIFEAPIFNSEKQFILSDIVDREVKKHIKKKWEDINIIGKSMRLISNVEKINVILDSGAYNFIFDEWEVFKTKHNVIIVSSKNADVDSVIEDYFNGTGVFTLPGKKQEFPDALATSSLLNYVGNNEVIVCAYDPDWQHYFCNKANVVFTNTKEQLIEKVMTDDVKVQKVLEQYINKKAYELIDDYITDDKFSIYLNNLAGFNEEYYVKRLECDGLDDVILISINEDEVAFVICFESKFEVVRTWDDLDNGSYDPETKDYIFYETYHDLIEGKIDGYLECKAKLSKKHLSITKLNVSGIDFNYDECEGNYKITATCCTDTSKH